MPDSSTAPLPFDFLCAVACLRCDVLCMRKVIYRFFHAQVSPSAGYYNATGSNRTGCLTRWAGTQLGTGLWSGDSGYHPPCCPFSLSAWRCRECARWAAWAGRPPSRDLHAPLVRLCTWDSDDARHVGTDIWARQSNCAETLQISGTALGKRQPTSNTL